MHLLEFVLLNPVVCTYLFEIFWSWAFSHTILNTYRIWKFPPMCTRLKELIHIYRTFICKHAKKMYKI